MKFNFSFTLMLWKIHMESMTVLFNALNTHKLEYKNTNLSFCIKLKMFTYKSVRKYKFYKEEITLQKVIKFLLFFNLWM